MCLTKTLVLNIFPPSLSLKRLWQTLAKRELLVQSQHNAFIRIGKSITVVYPLRPNESQPSQGLPLNLLVSLR